MQAQPTASRRQIAGAAASVLLAFSAAPAHAFLGFGEDPKAAAEVYTKDTVSQQLPGSCLALPSPRDS